MSLTITSSNIGECNLGATSSGKDLFSELSSADARTENGAKSYSIGCHDPRVVLFTKSVRGLESKTPKNPEDTDKYLEFLLDECWKVSPIDTLRLIFYIRDCRGGKGEKRIFYSSCDWLMRNHLDDLKVNMRHIPFYGSWKDLLEIFCGSAMEGNMIRFYTNQLQADIKKLDTSHSVEVDTGAAKFAPSEKCHYDRKYNLVAKFCGMMGITKAVYRKKYLRPLRSARTKITEEQMCAREWNEIDFSKVPSIAMSRYKKCFSKRCENFGNYIKKVNTGEAKINVSVLTPPEIFFEYGHRFDCYTENIQRNDVIEAQFKQLITDRKKLRNEIAERSGLSPANILPIIDVSGSMYTNISKKIRCIDVSLSVGILVSLLNDENSPFHRKWITFSSDPKMEELKGDDLIDIVKNMDHKDWGMSTNFQSVFDMILTVAKTFNIPVENMPKMLLVISDMQFDEANRGNTNWECIEQAYAESGYTRPALVFWNTRGNTVDMPIPNSDVPNCALVGGFSANILDSLIDGIIPSPLDLVFKTINSERYSRIVLASSN